VSLVKHGCPWIWSPCVGWCYNCSSILLSLVLWVWQTAQPDCLSIFYLISAVLLLPNHFFWKLLLRIQLLGHACFRQYTHIKINLTPKLTAVLSGHGKTRAYLHRVNLKDEAKCICGKEDQTMDHFLFHCTKTSAQWDILKLQIKKQMNLQDSKLELITKHRKVYSSFIESIDFDLTAEW
jgi:hypothetical protein